MLEYLIPTAIGLASILSVIFGAAGVAWLWEKFVDAVDAFDWLRYLVLGIMVTGVVALVVFLGLWMLHDFGTIVIGLFA